MGWRRRPFDYPYKHPKKTIVGCIILTVLLSLPILRIKIDSDPESIWIPQNTDTAREKTYFDKHYGRFFRIEQLIFTSLRVNEDLIAKKFLVRMAQVQKAIENASIMHGNNSIRLNDLCFKPIEGRGCLVESPLQFWLGNTTLLENDVDVKLTAACHTLDPTLRQKSLCMDQLGTPVMRNVVFGGLSTDPKHPNPDPCGDKTPRAQALIVTFLLENAADGSVENERALLWEKSVLLSIASKFSKELEMILKPRCALVLWPKGRFKMG